MYNLDSLGKARRLVSMQHTQTAKRQKGITGDPHRVEPTIEVDLEAAELQVGTTVLTMCLLHTPIL
jgi:hypothetical protein